MSFTLRRDDARGVTLVRVAGQLVVANRQELKDAVLGALHAGERKFVIDFAGADYVDSSGLGALVSLAKKIEEAGGRLRLSGLNEDLRGLFELTRLDALFTIADSTDQAIAALSS